MYTNDEATTGIEVDTLNWLVWLGAAQESFSYKTVNFRPERRRNILYWYGYKRRDSKLLKAYAGRHENLTLARLDAVAAALCR